MQIKHAQVIQTNKKLAGKTKRLREKGKKEEEELESRVRCFSREKIRSRLGICESTRQRWPEMDFEETV